MSSGCSTQPHQVTTLAWQAQHDAEDVQMFLMMLTNHHGSPDVMGNSC